MLVHIWPAKTIKGKLRSNEVTKSPRLHIERMDSYDKTIQTRIFLAGSYCNIFDSKSTAVESNEGTNSAIPFGGGGYLGKLE